MSKKTIALVTAFDTKGHESLYVKKLITKNGFNVVTIDIGTGVRGHLIFTPDYPKEKVAEIAGSNMEEILNLGKNGQEMPMMDILVRGASRICNQLIKEGKLHGVISLGGTMGTNLGSSIMRTLPFGLPKVMISTIASGQTRTFVGTSDIVMIPSVADILGLNPITRIMLNRAAGAIMGMVAAVEPPAFDKPLIGVTTLGGTQKCVENVRKILEEKGYEFVVFHANGVGGKTMDELVEQNIIKAVFDLSPNEIIDHMYHGWGDAGPTRLEIAGRLGVPQLVATANMDHIIYETLSQIPERFKNHYIHHHGPAILALRTQKKDMEEIADVMAEKLNKSRGPTAVIHSIQGLSVLDRVDRNFVDDEANAALFERLKKKLRPDIEIKELDCHVNDELFGREAAKMLYCLINAGKELS